MSDSQQPNKLLGMTEAQYREHYELRRRMWEALQAEYHAAIRNMPNNCSTDEDFKTKGTTPTFGQWYAAREQAKRAAGASVKNHSVDQKTIVEQKTVYVHDRPFTEVDTNNEDKSKQVNRESNSDTTKKHEETSPAKFNFLSDVRQKLGEDVPKLPVPAPEKPIKFYRMNARDFAGPADGARRPYAKIKLVPAEPQKHIIPTANSAGPTHSVSENRKLIVPQGKLPVVSGPSATMQYQNSTARTSDVVSFGQGAGRATLPVSNGHMFGGVQTTNDGVSVGRLASGATPQGVSGQMFTGAQTTSLSSAPNHFASARAPITFSGSAVAQIPASVTDSEKKRYGTAALGTAAVGYDIAKAQSLLIPRLNIVPKAAQSLSGTPIKNSGVPLSNPMAQLGTVNTGDSVIKSQSTPELSSNPATINRVYLAEKLSANGDEMTDVDLGDREKDWVVVGSIDDKDQDEDWDMCPEGEKLKEAKVSWNMFRRQMISEQRKKQNS